VAYATQESNKLAARESNNVRRVEYACKEKAPQRGGALPKALDFGFAVSAAARYNLAAFSGCPATLRSARRSGLFIRRIKPDFHC